MSPLVMELADEAATAALAEDVAMRLCAGDLVALHGDIGVGKTTFARALIRAVADDPRLEVPSPTFTLAQSYADGPVRVTHFDLYRLAAPDELEELGLDEALGVGAAVVEWPDRADLSGNRLDIRLAMAGTGRRAVITGSADWRTRLLRSLTVRRFLDSAGRADARRRYLQGDASTRRYEQVIDSVGRRAVVMDWPSRDAPSASDQRSAYRARNVAAFVAVDGALRAIGLSAPEVLAADLEAGLLLLEDLGRETIAVGEAPDPDRYACAIDVLAWIHADHRPESLPGTDSGTHRLPVLDSGALGAELALFTDWYVPFVAGTPLSPAGRASFESIWAALFERLARVEKSWVLFDVQAPNLPWLADRSGLARVGLLDFQDMFFGPAAFDVASLCQDMRVTVPVQLETRLRKRYIDLRRSNGSDFDEGAFLDTYAILAAERASKNLGVFARLAEVEGRRDYLQHMPRVRNYLARALAHPALDGYAHWCQKHLPPTD
ncbi:MAG: tRNA (adenosine(37)-N6)-threonylcarbamoyltransferase complex ATPase subunit type 1 TsaE [Hyphomicrobiales bacterium]|nr:tRNA (adenosine(37)-N6)-threonylcarbamoyltransferase complex ATPase subunit type 1 TsaE [Hyphomicrobiales bacterium]